MMTPQERKAALKAARIPQAEIARRTGFKPPYVSEVVHDTRRNPAIRRAIARAVRRPYREVWGEDAPRRAA